MNYYHNYLIEKNMKDNTITIDYGAAQPYDNITYSSSIDTITLSPSTYGVDSITVPSTFATTVNGSIYNTTVPNGGFTIAGGAGTGYNWSNTTANVNIDTDGISIKEGGDIKIAGKSLSDAIEKIEARLGILNPNPELEDRWERLRDLRKQYIDLEKDLLEKEKLMKILKEK
jgi:hypothetical protein